MVFGRIFSGLARTRERFASGLGRLLGLNRQLDEDFLDELEEILYTADWVSSSRAVEVELPEAPAEWLAPNAAWIALGRPLPRIRLSFPGSSAGRASGC